MKHCAAGRRNESLIEKTVPFVVERMEHRSQKGWSYGTLELLPEFSVMLTGVVISSCPVLRIWVQEAHLTPPTFLLGRVRKPCLQTQYCPVTMYSCFLMAVLTSLSFTHLLLPPSPPTPTHLKVCKNCVVKWCRVKEYN